MREEIMTEILLESNILIDGVLHEENCTEYKWKTAMGNDGHESQTDACFADYGTMRPVLGGLNRRFAARLQTESVRLPLTSSATESKRCYSTSGVSGLRHLRYPRHCPFLPSFPSFTEENA